MYLNEDNFREYKDKIVLNKNKDKIKQDLQLCRFNSFRESTNTINYWLFIKRV